MEMRFNKVRNHILSSRAVNLLRGQSTRWSDCGDVTAADGNVHFLEFSGVDKENLSILNNQVRRFFPTCNSTQLHQFFCGRWGIAVFKVHFSSFFPASFMLFFAACDV